MDKHPHFVRSAVEGNSFEKHLRFEFLVVARDDWDANNCWEQMARENISGIQEPVQTVYVQTTSKHVPRPCPSSCWAYGSEPIKIKECHLWKTKKDGEK